MYISYASHSKFIVACEAAIIAHQEILRGGQRVNVPLGPGGYSGNIIVIIDTTCPSEFETDWSTNDVTRFPARIKAAATALRDSANTGRFSITHADGVLSILKA